MKLLRAMALTEQYAKCQECGSEYVGNGAGSLTITDDTFLRECKCGWKVEIKDGERA